MMQQHNDTLYLGSQSQSRQALLRDTGIQFDVLTHATDERAVPFCGDADAYVQAVAASKMEALQLPNAHVVHDRIFVVTADTMVYIKETGELFGKPIDRDDAMRMFAVMYQYPAYVVTGVCLRVYHSAGVGLQLSSHEQFVVGADVIFKIHPDERELYLTQLPHALQCCAGGIVEGFGANYVQAVYGSYSAVIGLPLYQLRERLRLLGFRF